MVVRGGAIGDFILTLPVLSALREQFPDAAVELLGYPHIAELARAGGLADQVSSIDARALASFFARNGPLNSRLADYFGGVSLILSYLYDPDEIFRTNVARCSRAQFIQGPHRPNEAGGLHATEVFLKPLERLAIFEADPTPRLRFSTAGSSDWPTGQWLAIHPGSGSPRKNWPEWHWAELLQKLVGHPVNLLLVGGEAEGARLEWLAEFWPAERLRIARSLPLVQLAGLLQRCHFFVGHDSGISHLAGSLGLAGLVLWGPTNQAVWAPRNPQLRLLQSPGELEELPVERVLKAITSELRL